MMPLVVLVFVFVNGIFWLPAASPAVQDEQDELEIALAYGRGVFEPWLWETTSSEKNDRTTVTWTSDDLAGLGYLEYLHFGRQFDVEELDTFFNKRWFKGIFANYASWKERDYCAFGHIRLIEFDVVTSYGADYRMRYWLQYVSPSRVAALFVTFPVDDSESLDDYAARLFPDRASCEDSR